MITKTATTQSNPLQPHCFLRRFQDYSTAYGLVIDTSNICQQMAHILGIETRKMFLRVSIAGITGECYNRLNLVYKPEFDGYTAVGSSRKSVKNSTR